MLAKVLTATAVTALLWSPAASADTTGLIGDATARAFFAPEDRGPRRLEVIATDGIALRKAPKETAPELTLLAEGDVLSNLGCEIAGDTGGDGGGNTVWCQVKPLGSRTRGYLPATALQPARGPDRTVPLGIDNSPERAREGLFDLEGTIPCAQNPGQPLTTCRFGVARGTGGDATVVVTFPNSFRRTLSFAHGRFIRADTTMSGTGFDTDWERRGDLHLIRVEDQRYELPHTDIFGR